MAIDIGGMLARSGAVTGQAMGQGLANLGTGIGAGVGGMLTRRREREQKERQRQTAALVASGQQMEDQAKALAEQRRKDLLTKQAIQLAQRDGDTSSLQAIGLGALDPAEYLKSRATRLAGVQADKAEKGTQKGIQGGLSAITQAAIRGVPLTDLQEGIRSVTNLGGTQEQIIDAYKAGADILKGEKPEPTQYDYSEETILGEDGKPLRVQVAASTTDPDDRKVIPIGPAVPSGDKVGSKTLNQLLLDAGLDPADYDTTTVAGLKNLRSFVVTDIGNASLANTLTSMIEEKAPIGVTAAFDMINKIDPSFAAAQEDLFRVEKFKGLQTLADQDVSGLKNLLERVVSGTTESDVKAVSELQQFRGDKDLVNKIKDFASGLVSGKLSPETVSEYAEIMEIIGALSEQRQLSTINSLIISGTPREVEAALRAKTFITEGSGQARVVN